MEQKKTRKNTMAMPIQDEIMSSTIRTTPEITQACRLPSHRSI